MKVIATQPMGWMILLVTSWSGLPSFANESLAGESAEPLKGFCVEFDNDVVPILTRYGCNSGACHGAAIGRGGFKLSLYGSDPQSDFDAIVRQSGGRRINLVEPELSLLLRKPTETVEHGGGLVFGDANAGVKRIQQWIAEGARRESSRTLERVEVEPLHHIFAENENCVQIKVTAHFRQGQSSSLDDRSSSSRDVTDLVVLTPEDSSAVSITETGLATVHRRGRHLVVARFLDNVVPIELILPIGKESIQVNVSEQTNFIDKAVIAKLETLRISPSAIANDASLRRRLSLDLTGRLPQPLDRPFDRNAYIDQLLESAEFTEYWTYVFGKLLRIKPVRDDAQGAKVYQQWLSNQIADGFSYKDLATELITSHGDSHTYGPANFYRTVDGPRKMAEFASELFMGSRLRCANCHNHPLDRWTQDDYHGLAAIFAKVKVGRLIQDNPAGKVTHPKTLEPAVLSLPAAGPLSTEVSDARKQFARWLTDSQNPYFAKAIVNRLWKQMMGRGLVEPVDDFRDTNPATHPILLQQLADDFVDHGFDFRRTLRLIAQSSTYARSSEPTAANRDDDRFYSHAIVKPLPAEVLADAISDVLGVDDRYGELPTGTRAIQLVDPKLPSRSLDVLGRCDRQQSCEGAIESGAGLSQKLHLLNGPILNARISAHGSRLDHLLAENMPTIDIVQEFYRAALSRSPSDSESSYWASMIRDLDESARREFLEDFVWSLLNGQEFLSNR